MKKSCCHRFQPHDYELLMILLSFITGKGWFNTNIGHEDLYGNKEPWEIYNWDSHQKYQYFFTKLNRKSSRLEHTRTVGKRRGTWHGQDKGKSIIHKGTGVALGYKRCFLYRNKEEPEQDWKWLLKEFYLNDAAIMKATGKYPVLEDTKDFVVCRLQRKKSADDKPQEINDVPIAKILQILMGIPVGDSTATETLPPPPPTEEILAQPAGVGENNNGGGDDDDMGILNEDPELVAIQQRLLEELFIV